MFSKVFKLGESTEPSNSKAYSAGWWFGTFFIFPYIGNFIIPIDFPIFQRGWSTTNQSVLTNELVFEIMRDGQVASSTLDPDRRHTALWWEIVAVTLEEKKQFDTVTFEYLIIFSYQNSFWVLSPRAFSQSGIPKSHALAYYFNPMYIERGSLPFQHRRVVVLWFFLNFTDPPSWKGADIR